MLEFQEKYIKIVKEKNEGKKLKYNILTMGCQLNENDSEKIAGMLEEMGYINVDEYKEADIIIFNTCCVRENAEEKLFGKIRRNKKNKRTEKCFISYWRLYDARKNNG